MGEFFKGWRRKAGLVTLAMACLLMTAWIRSHFINDMAMFPLNGRQHELYSMSNQIWWQSWRWVEKEPSFGIESIDLSDAVLWALALKRRYQSHPAEDCRELIIPYWSLVLPLTLLSAWLILIKPRKAKPSTGNTP